MDCPFSGKPCNLPRQLHVTDVIDGKLQEMQVCESCEVAGKLHQVIQKFFTTASTSKLKSPTTTQVPCPTCGIRLEDICKIGRMGCSTCYTHFGDDLRASIQKMQNGGKIHAGKKPRHTEKVQMIADLEKQMKKAVKDERYEEAAKIRDQLKELNKAS